MKNNVIFFAMLMMSIITWKVGAQYSDPKVTEPGSIFEHEITLNDLGSNVAICVAIKDFFKGYNYGVGKGVEGLRHDHFMRAYHKKKDFLKGKPCTPYFKVDVGEYYIEGQLFDDPITGLNLLIRGVDGNYYVVSSEFVKELFHREYLCLGLPSSDWDLLRTSNDLPYKVIKFTKICESGETETITIAGLYYDKEIYAPFLDFQDLPICASRTVILKPKS